jgi:arylsulfatase A-like enzyme
VKHRWLIALPALFAIAAGLPFSSLLAAEQIGRPPNILLIVLDDFGYNDLGANGNPDSPTPHLDALAAQGTRYTRHYADASCSVARAALMTGTFPAVNGLRPNHLGLSVGTPTIASMLRQAGYLTQHIGKWHIVNATLEQSPTQLGFERWFGFLHNNETGGPSQDNGITYPKPTYINPWLRDNQSPLTRYTGHLTDIFTQRAINFLDQQQGSTRPWFLNLWYFAPHDPIQPPDDFRKKYPASEEGAYHALIDHLDANIGQVLAALDRDGQRDNTLVIVLSDNGGTNRETDNNYPFYGKKTFFLEGGLRTPMLMRWPGHITPNAVSDELVSIYDIFPTIAQASSATPPPQLIGRSLLNAHRAPTPQLYWEYSNSRKAFTYSILSAGGNWRLTYYSGMQTLYDLVADPTGKENVIDRHPEVAAKLTEDYLKWRKSARNVEYSYELLDNNGGAVLRGNDLQRSPGYSGFTFAIGVTPESGVSSEPQVIAEQSGRWRLQINSDRHLTLDILGQTIEGPPLPSAQCSEVVVSSFFNFSPLFSKHNWSIIDLYINGKPVGNVFKKLPPLLIWGYANPTYIGSDANGKQPFVGQLTRPIILNERVTPDDQSTIIGNGISGVPATCLPAAAIRP